MKTPYSTAAAGWETPQRWATEQPWAGEGAGHLGKEGLWPGLQSCVTSRGSPCPGHDLGTEASRSAQGWSLMAADVSRDAP